MPDKKLLENKRDDGVELETQFILRMPEEPAKELRETLRSGTNSLKDRLTIKIEPDMRYGEVRFDNWLLYSKIVDLPTIIETLKTIDNKSFYKTADACQMMICKFEPDITSTDEESPNKAKKKDPNKVDKKFLWPHGITPPCKNVRKRRFRKTLKKKYVEAPEIEKEVKRLLRVDNEAASIKYEIINEDEDQSKGNNTVRSQQVSKSDKTEQKSTSNITSEKEIMQNIETKNENPPLVSASGVAALDIFGGDVSSSDEEDNNRNLNVEDVSRLSAYPSPSCDISGSATASNTDNILTEFSNSMFNSSKIQKQKSGYPQSHQVSNISKQDIFTQQNQQSFDDNNFSTHHLSRDQINLRIAEKRRQSDELKNQQALKAQEISTIQNPTLRQRMQEVLDNILSQILEKEMEIQDLQNML